MEDVVTGEAVVIDVPCARFPSRMVAIAIDIVIQVVLLAVLTMIVGATAASGALDPAAAAAIALSVTVAVLVGYPAIFETLSRGRSLGKLAMGLRVVGDDGGPERFRQALVRSLASVVEIWMLMGAPALITSMLSPRGKRLGDLFAGTFVIQERLRAQARAPVTMPPLLAGWAASLELSGLPDETAAMAHSYLTRFWELTPSARNEFGRRIAAEVASRVSPPPPPGTPPAVYLSAVVAERRAREMTRMAARAKQAGAAAPEPAPPAQQPAPAPGGEGRPAGPAGPGDGRAPAAGGFAPPA
ncbi:MAG TPA: RDD family protein [Streptosporangiaceae bacterium]|nr:RDD family protein [Streptosporangiaceae bacterium]